MSENYQLKKRNELPPFMKLPIQFDIEKLLEAFKDLRDYSDYTDLEPGAERSSFKALCVARKSLHTKFLSDEELRNAKSNLSSQQYRQLALTEFNGDVGEIPPTDSYAPFMSYRKIAKPESRRYVNIFDERNYTKRTQFCKGYWNEVLDTFKSQVTRTRFAYLAPHSSIKPHIDYNTDYSIRVHIPIITNPSAVLKVQTLSGDIESFHAPADGGVYFMNTGLRHWAENNGCTERVHLIVSINGQLDLKNEVDAGL